MSRYQYRVSGITADGQTWMVEGEITPAEGQRPASIWQGLPKWALEETFEKLTAGKAVFGKPGLGCQGPYRIRKLEIEEVS